jgi:hypothetical protein
VFAAGALPAADARRRTGSRNADAHALVGPARRSPSVASEKAVQAQVQVRAEAPEHGDGDTPTTRAGGACAGPVGGASGAARRAMALAQARSGRVEHTAGGRTGVRARAARVVAFGLMPGAA